MGLGGRAQYLAWVMDESELQDALAWAADSGLGVKVLGSGSNVVVGEAGQDGLVVRLALRGFAIEAEYMHVAAGEPWDGIVSTAVSEGLGGIECLSGIPGLTGATPIQNVGAYGQEIAQVIASVRVLDRTTLAVTELESERCEFDYRDSVFKRVPDRHIVLRVTLRLVPNGAPTLRYAELRAAFGPTSSPTLHEVRTAVLQLRRQKSMVLDPEDANSRSVGSFFTNPIVSSAEAAGVVEIALARGWVSDPAAVPRYPGTLRTPGIKLAAAWLIERAGIVKGTRFGHVGVSSHHALALVHHGGGTTTELLRLAADIRERVLDTFGVALNPEPALWGDRWPWEA